MATEPKNANSRRFSKLAKKLRNKNYRSTYLASHIKIFLANQISALRGNLSQEDFGALLGKPQPVVSRLQNPNYGKYTLQTLLDIATKMDLALIVRFVDYPTFLKMTGDFSDNAVRPESYTPEQVDNLVAAQDRSTAFQPIDSQYGEFKQKLGGGALGQGTANLLTPLKTSDYTWLNSPHKLGQLSLEGTGRERHYQ
jgi:hypothetical protein